MATIKHRRRQGRSGIGRGLWRWIGLGALILVLGLGAWKGPGWRKDALTAAGLGAHVACSCHYIEGRDLAQCKADFDPGMEPLMLSEDSASKSVTARYPLLASQTATFRAGEGCVMEKWEQ